MLSSFLKTISEQSARVVDYESLVPSFNYDVSSGIPKIFWRAFITQQVGTPMPNRALDTEKELKTINPGYDIYTVDNAYVEDFIKTHYGDVIWDYYCRIDPCYGACRADLFRYLLLYKQGGIWIDLKCSCQIPMNEALRSHDRLLLSHWDNLPGEEHEGWGHLYGLEHVERGEFIMGCIPVVAGHPLMRAMILRILSSIDQYNPHVHNVGFAATMWTSGPMPFTLVALELMSQGKISAELGDYREVSFARDLGFVYEAKQLQGLSNYRTNLRPLVIHRKKWVNKLNCAYFKLLGVYRRTVLGKS